MWTRRVLLVTLVAAAAMTLPRQLPAYLGGSWAASAPHALAGAMR